MHISFKDLALDYVVWGPDSPLPYTCTIIYTYSRWVQSKRKTLPFQLWAWLSTKLHLWSYLQLYRVFNCMIACYYCSRNLPHSVQMLNCAQWIFLSSLLNGRTFDLFSRQSVQLTQWKSKSPLIYSMAIFKYVGLHLFTLHTRCGSKWYAHLQTQSLFRYIPPASFTL